MHNCKLLVKITSFSPFSTDQLYNNLLATMPNYILYQVYMGVCWVSELFLSRTIYHFITEYCFSCLQDTENLVNIKLHILELVSPWVFQLPEKKNPRFYLIIVSMLIMMMICSRLIGCFCAIASGERNCVTDQQIFYIWLDSIPIWA